MLGRVRNDWSSHGLITRQEVCLQSSATTSDFEQLMVWASPRLVASISWSSPIYPTSRPWLGIHLAFGSRGPPRAWPLASFSTSSAQWCSVNTTPSQGSDRQLRRFTRVWRLEPARERFRRWMKTRVARPPYQVECSCQTTKALSLSRAPYTPYRDTKTTGI